MTIELPIRGSKEAEGFTLTVINGCYIVTPLQWQSGIPMSAMAMLSKIVGRKAVMSADLQRVYGAIFVAGLPEDIKALREHPMTARLRVELISGVAVSKAAEKWLMHGEFGMSSYAIFHKMTGQVPHRAPRETTGYPHDPDDLRRCLLLLEQVPEFNDRFSEMRDVSPEWAALVDHWDVLRHMLQFESPEWRDGGFAAPQTYGAMQRLFRDVAAEMLAAAGV